MEDLLFPGPGGQAQGIYTGDALNLGARVAAGGADLVFTDPVYRRLDQYEWLGRFAMRVLRGEGNLLAWVSVPMEAACRQVLEAAGLRFRYSLSYVVVAKARRLSGYKLFTWTSRCLWLAKGNGVPRRWIPDTVVAQNGRPDSGHPWCKNMPVIRSWLEVFTDVDDLVVDPFCGEGPVPAAAAELGRRWLAFEIDPERAQRAHERVTREKQEDVSALPLAGPQFGTGGSQGEDS